MNSESFLGILKAKWQQELNVWSLCKFYHLFMCVYVVSLVDFSLFYLNDLILLDIDIDLWSLLSFQKESKLPLSIVVKPRKKYYY